MKKKMYVVSQYSSYFSATIRVREVIRETDHNIWTEKYGQEKKNTTMKRHFESWNEAHTYLLKRGSEIVRVQRGSLESAEEELEKVKLMESP